MLEMKTTRELSIGDRIEVDDQAGTVTACNPLPDGWAVTIKDEMTGEIEELDIAPTDVDVPIWAVHNPE